MIDQQRRQYADDVYSVESRFARLNECVIKQRAAGLDWRTKDEMYNQNKTDAARQRPTRQSVGVNASVESDLTRELFDTAEIAAMRAALS